MTRIKSKSVLRIEFLDNTHEQIVLANYLRGKDAKGQILAASTTVLYPYALAEHDGVDLQDVDFAFESSIAEMEKQIKVMRRYKQIKLGHNSADNSQPEPQLAQNQMSKKSVNFVVDEEDEDSNSENLNFSVRRFNDN
jgi:hypothetical protein